MSGKKLSPGKIKSRAEKTRRSVQIFVFVLVAFIAVNHSLEEIGKSIGIFESASLHAVCPFGGVVSIYQYLSSGVFVQKIHESSFILMILVFILAITFGPVFCGWICPFGSLQEWIGKIGKKIFKKKFNRFIPYKFDKWLRFLRYIVLGLVLYMTIGTGKLMFANIDPYYALFNFWTGEVAISGFIVLGISIVLSLFVERPFCKYACPYGAVLGLTNLVRIFKIKRNPATCTNCKACDKACPMNIPVSGKGTVNDHQCISCLKCTSEQACPVADTVEMTVSRFGIKKMEVK